MNNALLDEPVFILVQGEIDARDENFTKIRGKGEVRIKVPLLAPTMCDDPWERIDVNKKLTVTGVGG